MDSEEVKSVTGPEGPADRESAGVGPGPSPPAPPAAPGKGLTRRQLILYGSAGLAGAGLLAWPVFKGVTWALGRAGVAPQAGAPRPRASADVFKGDAPPDAVWELWRKRGWVREAQHYVRVGRNVLCKLCPNNCLLEPGDRSHCRNKVNRDGTLYTLAYANPCAMHVDPVEKKPLFHFFPGHQTFSLATAGCVFRCLNCQNWEISQRTPEQTKDAGGEEVRLTPQTLRSADLDVRRVTMFPEDVVAVAQALNCPSISFTYSEPIAYYEYTYETCKLARQRGLKNILVTCGSINERALRDLGQFVDAAHVDLKGFDEGVYWKLNTGRLQPVLDALKTLKSMGVWFEVINLVVPTWTDDLEVIRRMCGWLVENIGPDYPIHFSRFHPAHKLTQLAPTPVATLLKARSIAQSAGLNYVYVGNVRGLADVEQTFCPGCRRMIVQRDLFAVTANDIRQGKCRFCQRPIAGVWG